MTVDFKIVPAHSSHIPSVAQRMRQADRDEIAAASGRLPAAVLEFSLENSTAAWTAIINGRPEVMFGVATFPGCENTGAPWLLGTDAVERYNHIFLRRSLEWLDQLFERYAVLRGLIHEGNSAGLRWLQWLGFRLSDPVSIRGHSFRAFEAQRCAH